MKFMLLQDYGGVPEGTRPMGEWTPEEIDAHIQFQKGTSTPSWRRTASWSRRRR